MNLLPLLPKLTETERGLIADAMYDYDSGYNNFSLIALSNCEKVTASSSASIAPISLARTTQPGITDASWRAAWHGDHRHASSQIDHQVELGRLHNWQFTNLLAL